VGGADGLAVGDGAGSAGVIYCRSADRGSTFRWMTAWPTDGSAHPDRSPAPSFDLVESKLQPPGARAGIVPRTALVDRLVAPDAAPILAVVAPAGYGKTMLLAQWAERRRPRAAWVSCDDGDNDPAVLLTYLAAALARVGAIDRSVFQMLSSGADVTIVRRFMTAASTTTAPVAVAFDHVEAITNRECLDMLAEIAVSVPAGWQLAIASRYPLHLPLGRLRAHGRIMEIAAADLAMGPEEATSLIEGVGLRLPDGARQELLKRTEGWPTGLYLAAVELRTGVARWESGLEAAPDGRYMSGYLHSELLEGVSSDDMSFLTRTSVLDAMSGSLCDAVLGITGSDRILEQLQSRNLMIVPLDRHREWYRYHRLLGRLLREELERREPDLVRELHSRAATWFEANGRPEAAIGHAQAIGDADLVARLVLSLSQPVWASGRVDTVLHWMTWFEREGVLDRHPAIAVHGALIFALLGQQDTAERWSAVAEQAPSTGLLSDGNTMESLLAYLRAILAPDGVERMRQDARHSLAGLSLDSPYRSTMLHTVGLSHLIEGDPDGADPFFASGFDDAIDAGAWPLAALLLAERCLVAIARRDWHRAEAFTDRALSIVEAHGLQTYWTSALVYAAAARVCLHRGDAQPARQHAAQAARLRPLLISALPVVSVQALLELARVYMGLADPGGADAVLRHVQEILADRPDLGELPAQAQELSSMLERFTGTAGGASSLTSAELRLLPLLSTHLSLAEIGTRLNVSRHTVKTQVSALYRKLDVSSRREAVARARELGLTVG
jgi:LuxR family maltose regulon positive regulatory protein